MKQQGQKSVLHRGVIGHGNLPIRCAEVMKWHSAQLHPKMSKSKNIISARPGCHYVVHSNIHNENLQWIAQNLRQDGIRLAG